MDFAIKELKSVNNPRSIHGIYPYRGKISALDAEQILSQMPRGSTVLDPFCGSGTIVYEGLKFGLHTIGVDANPIAVALSNGKIHIPLEFNEVAIEIEGLIHKAFSLKSFPSASEYPASLFHEESLYEIMRLSVFYEEMSDYVKACYLGTIALTARGCNHYKWTSSTVGKNIEPKRYIPVYDKLRQKVKKHFLPKFGSYGKPFNLKDVKFDRSDVNIHKFCTLLLEDDLVGKYCRFKENPLDDAGCSITNGILSDTTKSKEVSNTINAMHALGFVERVGRKVQITSFGLRFAKATYGTADMQAIINKAVLNYGPVVGVMYGLSKYNPGDTFNVSEINVGYPSPNEFVNYNGSLVELSAGSTQDSNTRTKSCLLAWLTQGGYIKPVNFKAKASPYAHIAYRDYINCEHRMSQVYEIIEFPNTEITDRPLSYDNLTKMNFCLRENGQSVVSEATMYYETVIKNRRFAILYLLNLAYQSKTAVALSDIIDVMKEDKSKFVVSEEDLEDTVSTEIEIAFMAGIPYVGRYMNGKLYLQPTKGLNLKELEVGAPQDVINFLNQYSY